MSCEQSVQSTARNLANWLTTRVLENIAGASPETVLSGRAIPARSSGRRRFPRIDAYYDEYLGHQPEEGDLPGHYHSWPELATTLEGRLNVIIGSQVYESRQGDWMVFAPGLSHTECHLTSRAGYRLLWFVLLPDGQVGFHQTCYSRSGGYHVENACRLHDVPPDIISGVLSLCSAPWDPLEEARWRLLKLVNWCLTGMMDEVTQTAQSCHHLVAEVRAILEDETGRPPTVAELANQVGLSPNYLSNLFRRHTGRTIRQFVQHHRIELAKQHLADPSRNIKQITRSLGFATPQHFTYVFRRVTGVTPAAYRQQLLDQSGGNP